MVIDYLEHYGGVDAFHRLGFFIMIYHDYALVGRVGQVVSADHARGPSMLVHDRVELERARAHFLPDL